MPAMRREMLQCRAEDTLHYHDVDRDGVVSEAELLASLTQWHVVNRKLREAESMMRKKKTKLDVVEMEQRYSQRYPGGGRGGIVMSSLSAEHRKSSRGVEL
eukprot:gnl/TRDRNA2_/TRDRNA2_166059_c0_seq5.p3 gnl/TRDRNA2_/TRDRNA2_166059_c0~~gnl/TRDRNA2_/TRDRNA2_166059_c0_seq5.p3  ORF type:complete len:101 (+),score=27.59 gnl/TRDRNA2_/TRDRNA2_166059_c0_seq5:189-491(+)